MSELEQNLYKKISVGSKKTEIPGTRTYRGFSSSTKDKSFKIYDHEAIKQDIINHFHIRQGEKLSDPTFGCIIWDILFEPFTVDLQQAIVENVTFIINYDPRVQAEEVIVDQYENGIQVTATVKFLNYSIVEEMRFNFDQQAGLIFKN